MKRLLFIVLLLAAVTHSSAGELTANLTWSVFNTPDNKTYIETYMSVIGNSIVYVKNKNGKLQGSVDVLMTFTMNDSIKSAKRYILNSPELKDTTQIVNFIDLQRFTLPVGIYDLQVTLTDINRSPQKPITNRREILVDMDPDSISISHIEFLESYSPTSGAATQISKSGYDMVPYVSSFFPENMDNLSFYAEIYNTAKVLKPEDRFLVLYYIEGAGTQKKLDEYNRFLKLTPQPVNPVLYTFDISKLPSGSYHLVVEVRSAANRLLSIRKIPFERFKPGLAFTLNDVNSIDVANTFAGRITDPDSLVDCIRSLRPISSTSETDFAENRIKAGDVKLMQQYLYNFWLARNDKNPEGAWLAYHAQVVKVDNDFGSLHIKGYMTDRGRVYLQYGPPDQRVVVSNEPSSYPYEIWQYYRINGSNGVNPVNQPDVTTQTNRKFVFADFDLVTNNYVLIHSDARGEPRDDNWQLRLVRRDNSDTNLDSPQGNPQYGGHADDYYLNPH